jgi:FtsP/CotA-like multicopper oxidase with cupredoxin domain
MPQPLVQHSGVVSLTGGRKVVNATMGPEIIPSTQPIYFENAPKDIFTALPDQVTRIKATFDKAGRFAWHCHILSHEDHEMMRVMDVVPPPAPP